MTNLYCWWSLSKRQATLLAFFLCLLAGLSLAACSTDRSCTGSCPSPIFWQTQPGQLAATGAAGTFAVKSILITPQQIQWYYVFLSKQHNRLQATASTSHLANTTAASSLATTVQLLGQISDYSIGVIHVDWADHVNQVIGLQLTAVSSTGARVGAWQLTLLQQVDPDPNPGWFGINTGGSGLPEAVWRMVPMGGTTVSYVKVIIPGQPVADRSYVFVGSDDPVTVQVISKAEYLRIAGPANFTS
jgi:hypothetical protein